MEPKPLTKEEMLEEFQADQELSFSSGRTNNITDIVFSVIGVVGSLIATVVAAADTPRWVIAAFAAVPTASASLQRIVDFRGRSFWYFAYAARLTAIIISLRSAANPDLDKFAEQRANLEVESEKSWGKIPGNKKPPKSKKL